MKSIFTKYENYIKDFILSKKIETRTYYDLQFLANRIRKHIINMTYLAGSGHPGGALGMADVFCVLYFYIMKYNVKNYFLDVQNDFLFMSNGHTCAVRYAAMALAGFFNESELSTHRQYGSRLQGHPSTQFFPEVIHSSGSLGQGLSVASGFALGQSLQNHNSNIFVSISDGECQEGMTWECILSNVKYKTNIIAFVDYNGIQIDGYTKDIMDIGDLSKKFETFNWKVRSANGHNYKDIIDSFSWALQNKNYPRVIIFHNTLGKGVSFMENQPNWHGVGPKQKDFEAAILELNKEQQILIQKNKESYNL